MTDAGIHHQITELVEQEHQLRATLAAGGSDEDRAALRQVEESLDQCWDLLRQRDAPAGRRRRTRTRPRPGRCPRSRATCSSSGGRRTFLGPIAGTVATSRNIGIAPHVGRA